MQCLPSIDLMCCCISCGSLNLHLHEGLFNTLISPNLAQILDVLITAASEGAGGKGRRERPDPVRRHTAVTCVCAAALAGLDTLARKFRGAKACFKSLEPYKMQTLHCTLIRASSIFWRTHILPSRCRCPLQMSMSPYSPFGIAAAYCSAHTWTLEDVQKSTSHDSVQMSDRKHVMHAQQRKMTSVSLDAA